MKLRRKIRRICWQLGLDVSKLSGSTHPIAARRRVFERYAVDLVLDVGANTGQFVQHLREEIRYTGRVVSFEPVKASFDGLTKAAARDPLWEVHHYALGDSTGTSEINVAGNSWSSSLLDMLPAHSSAAPESEYVGREVIRVERLDSVFQPIRRGARNIYMKVDTQGFEERVLRGAEESLSMIDTIQLEMSLVPLYQGELLFADMCSEMARRGYALLLIENGFSDPISGRLLQVDGIFHRFSGMS